MIIVGDDVPDAPFLAAVEGKKLFKPYLIHIFKKYIRKLYLAVGENGIYTAIWA